MNNKIVFNFSREISVPRAPDDTTSLFFSKQIWKGVNHFLFNQLPNLLLAYNCNNLYFPLPLLRRFIAN